MLNKLKQTFYDDKNVLDEAIPPDTLTLDLQVTRNMCVQIRVEFACLLTLHSYNYQITQKGAIS